MGNRLTKIYTRTGDDGTTALANGARVAKSDWVFVVMGDVDELNAHIGMVSAHLNQLNSINVNSANRAADVDWVKHVNRLDDTDNHLSEQVNHLAQTLSIIQHLLFNLGGELAMPEYQGINHQHIAWLEASIDALNANLPPLKDFILPAGSVLVSSIHIARTVCRRAERQAVRLQAETPVAISASALQLLNRLSDWLFVLARYCAKIEQSPEVLWDKAIMNAVYLAAD